MLLDANDLEQEEVAPVATDDSEPWEDEVYDDEEENTDEDEDERSAEDAPKWTMPAEQETSAYRGHPVPFNFIHDRLEQARLEVKICEMELKVAKLAEKHMLVRRAWKTADSKLKAMKGQVVGKAHDPADCTCPTCAQSRVDVSEDQWTGDSWREVSIDDLDIPAGIVANLKEKNEITTLGQLGDWLKGHKTFTELVGIGSTKAKVIAAAINAYWKLVGKTNGGKP